MKRLSGIETLQSLLEMDNPPKIIILSMHSEPRMISHVMSLGAHAYLIKDTKKEELEVAIRKVCESGVYLNQYVSSSLLAGLKTKRERATLHIQLSNREKEVLELICAELTTQEIAERLFISERTVEGHRKNLASKLDVKNTAGLVKKAILLRLVET